MASKEVASGMRGDRPRDPASGRLREKRSDTQMGTIEKQYGRDFKVQSDMQLGTYLKQSGYESLKQILNNK